MDSDGSAEGDFENESPKNRSWVSSNSEGQPSSPELAEKSDTASTTSDGEASPSVKPAASSSDRESSPDGKDSEASDVESTSDMKDVAGSDRESSPEDKHNDNSDQELMDVNDGIDSNKGSSPDDDSKNAHRSDKESSVEPGEADYGASSDRESSVDPEPKGVKSPDQVFSSDVKENEGLDRDQSPDANDTGSNTIAEVVNSPPAEVTSPENSACYSSPEKPVTSSVGSPAHEEPRSTTPDWKDPLRNEQNASPVWENDSHEGEKPSSPTWRSRRSEERNQSPIWKSPSDNAQPAASPLCKSPSNDQPQSPLIWNSPTYYEDRRSKNNTSSYKNDKRSYKNVNGNVSSKTFGNSFGDVNSSQYDRKNDFSQKFARDKEKSSENKKAIIDFADDLSDVSDIESNDSFDGAEEVKQEIKEKPVEEKEVFEPTIDKQLEDAVSLHVEEGEEQLDFEAEEGECSPKIDKSKEKEKKEKEHSDLEEGELTDDNDTKPEETERPVCRFFSRGHCTWGSNCRFIHPGVMDKGNYSMFETVRPIVTPGGPPPPNSAPIMYPVFPPHLPHSHIPPERAGVIPPGGVPRKDEPVAESAWERGLRQAKEMIRKSSKRKETEVDFEDKKMNLTLNQDEIDKENDYYSKHSGSPVKSPEGNEKWQEPYPNDLPPPVPHTGGDAPPVGYYPPMHHGMSRPEYWGPHRMGGLPYEEYGLRGPHMPYGPDYFSAAAGRRYMHPNSYYPPRPGNVAGPPAHHPEFYDRKQKHKQYPGSSREVIVQKNDKPYKDEKYRNRREESPRIERARDDEWADPWMRTKSPATGRRRRRKDTYSSGSSYSSSSGSSRSSSRSSFSSKSRNTRSRSKVRSSGSHSQSHSSSRSASESQTRKKPPMQFKLSPSSRAQLPVPKKGPKAVSPSLLMERRAATERAMHMNPPPPSPKVKTRPHSPPTANAPVTASPQKAKGGLPDRLLAHSKAAVAAAMRSARSSDSHSSKSSSGSSSSDSSSDSSDSSGSSSSSKSSKTPPSRIPKRSTFEDHVMSQNVKTKAMDALKLSGQKQQIKLTLKGSGGNIAQSKRGAGGGGVVDGGDSRKDRQLNIGKKRVAESSDSGSDSDRASPAKKASKANQKKVAPSRREELLKQLKAVEDAIARKRSSKNS